MTTPTLPARPTARPSQVVTTTLDVGQDVAVGELIVDRLSAAGWSARLRRTAALDGEPGPGHHVELAHLATELPVGWQQLSEQLGRAGQLEGDKAAELVKRLLPAPPARGQVRKLAVELHERRCRHNHTDGCAWHYEVHGDRHDWHAQSHSRWARAATELIERAASRDMDFDQLWLALQVLG